ncbi:uncharacterized protein (DUF427 family) [Actinocrispum wychmicini]|uniref:Uncharacterized protein (DUF427 family) n=2 Tax=Actinocrispum wychmicini TaxID=1213861 RepID=A0A4R2K4W6_9PSEU|nr:uncharacterized protein (DUF427 family) [Actinocrispum wychmicini]
MPCAAESYEGQTGVMATARWNGTVIAESDETVVVEGNHYFPIDSVQQQYLQPSETTSVCPWKGTASYYTLRVDGAENPDAAWYYPEPKDAAAEIKDRVAFWKGVDITG